MNVAHPRYGMNFNWGADLSEGEEKHAQSALTFEINNLGVRRPQHPEGMVISILWHQMC
jgi:hypothetical protein